MWDRRKTILSFIFVALVALLAYGLIVYVASMVALDEIDRDAALVQWQILQRALSSLSTDVQQTALDYAMLEDIQALARGGGSSDAGRIAEEIAARLTEYHSITLLMVLDGAGSVAYGHDLTTTQAAAVSHAAVAQAALQGQAGNSIDVIDGRPFIIAAAPLAPTQAAAPSGVLILGRAVDDTLAGELQSVLGRDIMLFRAGEWIAGSRSLSKKEQQLRESYVTTIDPQRIATHSLPDGGKVAVGQLIDAGGQEIAVVQMDIPDFAGPTIRPAITIASLVAIILGLAATYILAQAIGGQLARSADALARRERENALLYAEVQQLNQRFENLISERTTQLRAAVSELQEVQTQLIQSDRLAALGTLTASIVHELSTPLTTILGSLHMLLGNEQGEQNREWLEQARDAALLSQGIVTRVRALARRQRVRREMIDINQVVQDAVGLLRYQLAQSDIECRLELSDSLPRVMADETQAQQILFNVIHNARDALEQTRPPRTLIVRTERDEGLVRLLVLDNGPGLEDADIPRLFDPFYTSRSPDSGAGLGLYISKGIIESYGGRISGQNREDGPGTVFIVEFPAGLTGSRPFSPQER
jgi:signal transduction histidine kinase